eukprot:CAMPEP_0175369364 /NCGR_PEP_ID=MMETSP0095-20121207/20655_1 /TAXON_ID=311494 /ORGANISM="Alexandrium monilatum, Strain CCMP3105" /LENGTH=333 /DNA_ID=CAMNT_0016667481 /DNA_START=92 /DNA_END=1091 /DNA_ORIENTATION=-
MGAKCMRADDFQKEASRETSRSSTSSRQLSRIFADEAIEDIKKALACRCSRPMSAEPTESDIPDHAPILKALTRDVSREQLPPLIEPFAEVDVPHALPAARGTPGGVHTMSFKSSPELRPPASMSSEALVVWPKYAPEPVTLNIYNIGTGKMGKALNRFLRTLGTGAFHCGVEVYGREWSFSDTEDGGGFGVFCSRPRRCEGHNYSESVRMGRTNMTQSEVLKLIQLLTGYWPVAAYNTLTKNCCHFCNEFCLRLRVGSIPGWVMNLAGTGAAIMETGDTTCCRTVAREAIGPVAAAFAAPRVGVPGTAPATTCDGGRRDSVLASCGAGVTSS